VNVQVNSHDLLRMLAMIPVAPSQMGAEDFTAFINLAGASSAAIADDNVTITMIRVASSQSIFKSEYYNPPVGKVETIKQIRTFTGLGLKEAKDISDGVWTPVHLSQATFKQLQAATPKVEYEIK